LTVTGAGGPAGPGRLKLLLIVSLALNLLVISAVAGAFLMGPRRGHWHGGGRGEDFGLLGFARSLPADRRSEIRKSVQRDRAALKPLWLEMRKARENAAAVLVAEPYDKEKVKAAFEAIGAAENRLKEAGLAIFLNTAEQLTPDERRALGEWWINKKGRHFRFRDDKDDGPSDDKPAP
jgi:uncharacterized membrane protein